jgi:hypothetical protein
MARPMRIVRPCASAEDRSDATGTFSSRAAASKVNKAKGMICPPFVEFAQTHKRPFPVSLFVVLLHRTHHAEPFK